MRKNATERQFTLIHLNRKLPLLMLSQYLHLHFVINSKTIEKVLELMYVPYRCF